MRLVPQATMPPHRCAVIPFKGNSSSRGFIDTGMDLPGWDPHVYVSVEAVEEMARMIGWEPRHVSARHAQKTHEAQARISELEELLAGHERFREAAEYTLNQFGAQVRNKPGRKPRAVA
jgi:hypothetical protein